MIVRSCKYDKEFIARCAHQVFSESSGCFANLTQAKRESASVAPQQFLNRHVRFGSKADIGDSETHVRFAPESGRPT
jgi:hypothetical protein